MGHGPFVGERSLDRSRLPPSFCSDRFTRTTVKRSRDSGHLRRPRSSSRRAVLRFGEAVPAGDGARTACQAVGGQHCSSFGRAGAEKRSRNCFTNVNACVLVDQWFPSWGKLPPLRGNMRFLGGSCGTKTKMFCVMNDHCEIWRVIRHTRYLDLGNGSTKFGNHWCRHCRSVALNLFSATPPLSAPLTWNKLWKQMHFMVDLLITH